MLKFLAYPYRAYMISHDKRRMRKLPHYTEGFSVQKDIRYLPKNGKFHKLDVITPNGKEEEITPVVIDIHGGAYFFGYKWINDDITRYFATKSGYRVVNANYRIVGWGTDLFDAIKDVARMIQYIYDNADELKIDKNNIFLMGDSAGAHIMSLASCCFSNEEYRKALGLEDLNPNIKFNAAAYTCGVYTFDPFLNQKAARAFIKEMVGKDLSETSQKYKLSQFREQYKIGTMPIILNSAYGDFLRQQTLDLYDYLLKEGNESKLIFFEEPEVVDRKLEHVYNVMYPFYEESIKTNDEIIEFFKEHIK